MEAIISPGNVTRAYYSIFGRVLAMLDPESGCDVWKPMEDEFSDRARRPAAYEQRQRQYQEGQAVVRFSRDKCHRGTSVKWALAVYR